MFTLALVFSSTVRVAESPSVKEGTLLEAPGVPAAVTDHFPARLLFLARNLHIAAHTIWQGC